MGPGWGWGGAWPFIQDQGLLEESELTFKHSLYVTFLYQCKTMKNTSLS